MFEMAKIFVALNNFSRDGNNYTAMPPFYESFLCGLKDAGNEVKCFQTKSIAGKARFSCALPEVYRELLYNFSPDLCILFNNNFWDISDVVDCPIVIYDVDSPLEWQLKDNLINNISRYLFVYNQITGYEELVDYFGVTKSQCFYIPFFSEIHADPFIESENNIIFLGTNWCWKGYNFLNNFIRTTPSKSDIKKALEVLDQYVKEPLRAAHELYYELQNCPHSRINLGNLFRSATEISGLRRLKYLSAVSDLGLEINGYYWTIDMMSYFPELLACVGNKTIWTKQQTEKYYNRAKLSISTNHIQARGGFSFRACDVLASNACLVSEYSEDLKRLFPHLPLFTSPQEARDTCKYLLENENLRLEIVSTSHDIIDRKFRFKNVLKNLEDCTGLKLHSNETGKLHIFPASEAEARMINDTSAVKNKRITNVNQGNKENQIPQYKAAFYNSFGKHLGYDPYHIFSTKYVCFCSLKIFKILTINNSRKEVYAGLIPLISYNKLNGKTDVRLLVVEKMGKALKKTGNLFKKTTYIVNHKLNQSKKKKHLKLMQKKWKNNEPIKICFFVSRINCWMFENIYHIFEKSGKFQPVIVVKPFLSRGESYMKECMRSTFDALTARGFSPIKGYDEETDTYLNVRKELNPDIIFYTKFWKPHFHPYFYIDHFFDRMTLLIDYGYNITGHSEAMNFELQNSVDMYFYYSQKQKEIASKIMNNKAKNVFITGAPKLDPIFSSDYKPHDPWKAQAKKKKRIIWAPHHEDKTPPNMYQLDAFYDLYDVMLEIAEKYSNEVQFAFKPHPLLKEKLYNYWGHEATDRYYEKWDSLENAQLEDGEFIDLFLTSDAMILDCLSFIAEYTATGKPSMFTVGSKSRVLLNDFGKEIYSLLYHAEGDLKKQICEFIENVVLDGNDPLKEQRIKFVNSNMRPPNNKTAAENVYSYICSFITNGGYL